MDCAVGTGAGLGEPERKRVQWRALKPVRPLPVYAPDLFATRPASAGVGHLVQAAQRGAVAVSKGEAGRAPLRERNDDPDLLAKVGCSAAGEIMEGRGIMSGLGFGSDLEVRLGWLWR